MRLILITVSVVVLLTGVVMFVLYRNMMGGAPSRPAQEVDGRLWDYSTRTLEGKDIDLQEFAGQVALVVNVASKCGLTPQYQALEKLYRDQKNREFVILAFPSNDFMGQEPGSPAEIRTFCTDNYQVTFPLFEKVSVKGSGQAEIFNYLTKGGLEAPSWNFTKYLVGRDGRVVARFAPKTSPDDSELLAAIDRALGEPGVTASP